MFPYVSGHQDGDPRAMLSLQNIAAWEGEMVLEQERAFYDAHLDEWLQRYSQRFVLVRGQEPVGVFNTVEEALAEGARRFGLTSFLVRQVTPTPEPVKIPALALGVLGSRES